MSRNAVTRRAVRLNRPSIVALDEHGQPIRATRRPSRQTGRRTAIAASLLGCDI